MLDQQLLAIDLNTDAGLQELSLVAGDILRGDEHGEIGSYPHYHCPKCGLDSCTLADFKEKCHGKPIPRTPDNMIKWRKHTNDYLPLLDRLLALHDIEDIYNKTYGTHLEWWALEAEPCHWLLWSCLCEIRSKA